MMPNFDLAIESGLAVVSWVDPRALDGGEPTGMPSRLNPTPGYPEKRLVATVGVECELHAVVDNVDAPMDTELDGNLFYAATVEGPGPWQLPISSPAGQSSVKLFTPTHDGHYLIYVRRKAGGQIMVHFDAVDGT